MKVKKINIGPSHPLFRANCGNFTQVIIVAQFESQHPQNREATLAQFFGMQAKIMASRFITQMGWEVV